MKKLQKILVASGLVGLVTFLFAGAAGATPPPDPTGGAYGDSVGGVQSWIEDVGSGPLFLLAAAVLIVMVALRWLKRSKTAAT